MTIFEQVTLTAPYLRVNNRNHNLDFYQQTLGLKILSEENALAFLGGHQARQTRLTIEESPSYRTRAVEGTKKLHAISLRANGGEIAELLARQVAVYQVFQGKRGYAFSAISPEGHVFLLHDEDDVKTLEKIDYPSLAAHPDFVGLSDVTVTSVVLNVPDIDRSATFYANLPLSVQFVSAQGPDLTIANHETWDIEILEFAAAADLDLAQVQKEFAALGAETFLNKKQTQLIITDPSQLEIWFMK